MGGIGVFKLMGVMLYVRETRFEKVDKVSGFDAIAEAPEISGCRDRKVSEAFVDIHQHLQIVVDEAFDVVEAGQIILGPDGMGSLRNAGRGIS